MQLVKLKARGQSESVLTRLTLKCKHLFGSGNKRAGLIVLEPRWTKFGSRAFAERRCRRKPVLKAGFIKEVVANKGCSTTNQLPSN